MDKDALRSFYFSSAASFSSYAKKNAPKGSSHSSNNTVLSVSEVQPVEPEMLPARVHQDIPTKLSYVRLGSAHVAAVRSISTTLPSRKTASAGAQRTVGAPPPDAASVEYFSFLKQQQELQKHHIKLDEAISQLGQSRRDQQADVNVLRAQCREILSDIEGNQDCNSWKLKSKYDVQQLIRDCNLCQQPTELTPNVSPQLVGLVTLGSQLLRLKQSYGTSLQFLPHQLFVDQAMRRVSVLCDTMQQSNIDATTLARIADTLVVHSETVFNLPTLESLICNFESAMEEKQCKMDTISRRKADAINEGDVHLAERECYEVLEWHEKIIKDVVAKVRMIDININENLAVEQVRQNYVSRTPEEFCKIRQVAKKQAQRCQDDVAKVFALREKVEEVEAQTKLKTKRDIESSEKILAANQKRQEEIYVAMEPFERELEQLERERYREIQRRVAEKDKDEHRKTEFAKFCVIAEAHIPPLERTINNMQTVLHATDVIQEVVRQGFVSLEDDLTQRAKLLRTLKTESHKEHMNRFRALLLEFGDIIYRKERMVEETDKKIQQAHVQQELLAETFNPNAKKFGDFKKALLKTRDELELDITELKGRVQCAKDEFETVSEGPLAAAKVEYVNPVSVQEHAALTTKAKMIEIRAMVTGLNKGQSTVIDEIGTLQADVTEVKKDLDSILNGANVATYQGKSLALIRGTNRSRFGGL